MDNESGMALSAEARAAAIRAWSATRSARMRRSVNDARILARVRAQREQRRLEAEQSARADAAPGT